jgi:fluoride exporter
MPSLTGAIAVAIGAVPGALCRYGITEWSKRSFGQHFPYGTFLINVTGCLIMGFFVTLADSLESMPMQVRLGFATGFLGSYTTFSTYEYDTLQLWRTGDRRSTLVYWLGSFLCGAIALWMGTQLAHIHLN